MNNLLMTFLSKPELIYLHTIRWFQVLSMIKQFYLIHKGYYFSRLEWILE